MTCDRDPPFLFLRWCYDPVQIWCGVLRGKLLPTELLSLTQKWRLLSWSADEKLSVLTLFLDG